VTLTLTSPPYFMGKSYDKSTKLSDFQAEISKLAPSLVRLSKDNGSICWQVGYHAKNGEVYPLDYAIFEAFRTSRDLVLRNRIAWTFGHGEHCRDRFSGRHETILWYTKKGDYIFDLDAVRVPQKYPGKRHYKGPRRGEFSGNPFGKNPSDVWDIPNVKAGHVEKTSHPCQFPVALAQRLVNALSGSGDTVLDPYAGSGTTGIAALLAGRRFLGAEVNPKYAKIAEARYQALARGTLRYRADLPIRSPQQNEAVSQKPDHFHF